MDWQTTLLRIGIAIAVSTLIGVEREYKGRPAGMRTHVLVCLGACIVALIEASFMAEISKVSDGRVSYSFGRVTAQVITGVGFLGAGTIFTARKKIAGLTTAASLWNAACLGLAIGYGYYLIALVGGVFVLGVLVVMQRIVRVNTMKKLEIKFIHRVETITFINAYFESLGIQILDVDFHVENRDNGNLYTNIYTLKLPGKTYYTDIVNHLSEHTNVQSIRTTNT
ncbi:MAG: putative Mg(2+) transport ATPase [Firmicutes bacterium ADurb.Bin467]|nr:MAG: putative Mg(2+) transport ATPase [Firmicutes bacterium ADurb.Bin467]